MSERFEFDRLTAVTPADDGRGAGRYAAELAPGWVVGGGLNGGYLLAVMGQALRAAVPAKPDAVAVSAHYVSASAPGPALVTVDVRREGGSVATAAVDVVQDGAARITALATVGDLARFAARAPEVRTRASEPVLPPPDECIRSSDAPAEVKAFVPMLDRFDLRLDPAHAAWGTGEPGMTGAIAGWFRWADGREPDALSLLTVCDVLPPVTFDLGLPGWAPTLELTVHVRAHPAAGWLKVRHETRNLAGGMFEEDCEIWDSAGRLVAQSRQLALVPRPMA
jgi:acyl-coenzyme A thioesterase PaaI-like protein